jgi:hypothetical protein
MKRSGATDFFIFILIASVFTPFMNQTAIADTVETLRRSLPKQINAWTAASEDRIFDEKTIFSYINGAAEVYKAYNMRQCLSRRYTSTTGPAIVLDIFDMGSPEDAFGVFTHDTDGEPVAVGQDARYRPGWLSFWKHKFFISIYMEEETPAAEKAVMELGKQVAAVIKEDGEKPKILKQLPKEGLQTRDIRYLHHPVVLNYHYYLADENILNISPETDAVLAEYQWGKENALLLLVKYPDSETAEKSLKGFFNYYLPDADKSGTSKLEDGKWASAIKHKALLIIVLEADSRKNALRLLKIAQQRAF